MLKGLVTAMRKEMKILISRNGAAGGTTDDVASETFAVTCNRLLFPHTFPSRDLCHDYRSTDILPYFSRGVDLVMAAFHEGSERNICEWRQLFEQADRGHVYKSVTHSHGSTFSLIEHIWEAGYLLT